jgi:hypothetical protein
MSLLANLGLLPVAKAAAEAEPAARPSKAAKPELPPSVLAPSPASTKAAKVASAGPMPPPKAAKAKAPKGEVILDAEPSIVVEQPIGQLVWANRTRKVWGFTTVDGELASGGSNWQEKDLTKMTALAAHAVNMVVQMQTWEEAWRLDVAKVKFAAKQATADLAKVEAALPAMAERMKKDKDFFQDVSAYVRAETFAKGFVTKIGVAADEFKAAHSELKAAIYRKDLGAAEADQAAAEAALETKKAEVKEAQEIYKLVFEIGGKLIDKKWGEAAEKALEFVGEKIVDAAFSDSLDKLKAAVDDAKDKVRHFKTSALAEEVEAARHRLSAAVGQLKSVEDDFEAALDDLGNQQANAQNELKESGETKVVGKMIGERVKQLAAISAAKASCGVYSRAADGAKAKLSKIADEFAKVGSWLDQAAAASPDYNRDLPYAKMIERCARRNADVFWDWASTVPSAKRECDEAIVWLGDSSDKGPMGDFEKARKATSKGLKVAR